ncbi:MAG: hypothetical protein GMKNLPBB_00767 [Myxococcota bacterium]|nr:hypothetical protein [Myxococcota bacterium]
MSSAAPTLQQRPIRAGSPPAARERVLPTLNEDGSRRWLDPKPSKGKFWKRRVAAAWILIGVFTLLPWINIHGKPAVLLDIAGRHFTLFGMTFLPTDTVLLMLLMVSILLSVVLATALAGRVWCGWACPQTVYMEFLYRPIERLIEGRDYGKKTVPGWKKVLKAGVFLVFSAHLANTFLSYFVGVEAMKQWTMQPPLEHPTPFLVFSAVTGLMMLDFGYFREQVCMVACPYGRFQSVLLDRKSLIVGYDYRRGEPRGKPAKPGEPPRGDCIDCGACVRTCPTGIDIRDGLQMECIHCTQCMDACDEIMDNTGKPRGLIRYSSQDELAGRPRKFLRWRVVFYPAILIAALGALLYNLSLSRDADVTVLRGINIPFTINQNGEVMNHVRVRIHNRTDQRASYAIELADFPEGRLVIPVNPLPVDADKIVESPVFVLAPKAAIPGGERQVQVRVSDGKFEKIIPYKLLGPTGEGGKP